MRHDFKSDIYSYNDFRDFLKVAAGRHLAKRNHRNSLSLLSKRLGYRSPQSIAMVVNGRRLPSQEMVFRITKQFGFSKQESRYFECLVALERCKRSTRKGMNEQVAELMRELVALNPPHQRIFHIDADSFKVMAEWHCMAIKHLVDAPDFREDYEWIRRRLRSKMTAGDCKAAVDSMLRIGVLRRNPDTERLESVEDHIKTTFDVPSVAIKIHHKQMMQRATEALMEQPVDRREITSITLPIEPAQVKEAKDSIRAFRDDFYRRFESKTSTSIFQFNFQFFEHTQPVR